MSLAAMTWAIDAPISRPTAKLTLVCLADHADEHGACFPSQKALAERVGVTERAVRDALTWLEENGFITRTARHRKDGSRTSDSYQLPEAAYRKNFPHPRNETSSQPEESSGLTTFEPVTEPVTAAAREPTPSNLLDLLLEAAGISGNVNQSLAFPGEVIALVSAGYSLHGEILPGIRSKPNPRARTWAYFVPQIRDYAERIRGIAGATAPQARPKADSAAVRSLMKPETFTETRWLQALEFCRARSEWQEAYGPPPWSEGCLVPRELWQERDRERFGVGVAA